MAKLENYSSSEGEWEDDPIEEVSIDNSDEEVDEIEEPAVKKQKVDASEGAGSEKQPRISKQEQRSILQQRRKNKPNEPLINQCKKLWEQIRIKKLDKPKRDVLLNQLMDLVKGKCVEIIFKHDASRIIQCCLKYGNDEQRVLIAEELKGHYLEISKGQYGRFIVSKILKFCKNYRNLVINSFLGQVRKIIKHKEASLILEEIYCEYASALQKQHLMEEFYGPEYSIFRASSTRSLNELISENPVKRTSILKYLRDAIFTLLGKSGFQLNLHTIVHRAVLDYFKQLFEFDKSNEVTEINPQVTELIEALQEHLVHILHTREGAQVAQLSILYATPKLRKQIIKTLKSFIKKISMESYGFTVLLTIFECVDDTVLVNKSVLGELLSDAPVDDSSSLKCGILQLSRDKNASKIFLYLLNGRNGKFLPSFVCKELEAMDFIRSITSKKEDKQKRKELLKVLIPELFNAFSSEFALNEVIRCKIGNVVFTEFAKFLIRVDQGLEENFDMNDFKNVSLTSLLELLASQAKDLPKNRLPINTVVEEKKDSKRTFNAVLNLRENEMNRKQLESGINIDEHVLVNKFSTFVFKELLSLKPIKSKEEKNLEYQEKLKSSDKIEKPNFLPSPFTLILMRKLSENFLFWVHYCSNAPDLTINTSFILLRIVECRNLDPEVKEELNRALKIDKDDLINKSLKNVNDFKVKLNDSNKNAQKVEESKKIKKNSKVEAKIPDGAKKSKNFGIETLLKELGY
ncbi:hypothetical protein HDU92_003070 [Lobulomyces angularis]|nr:hypothetical protein HDU92_003070 [Lobulomyces angularis]